MFSLSSFGRAQTRLGEVSKPAAEPAPQADVSANVDADDISKAAPKPAAAQSAAAAKPDSKPKPAKATTPVQRPAWPGSLEASDDVVQVATEGSLAACTALVFPFTMVPYIGDTVDSVAEWVCIVPAVMAGQYAEENYGQRDTFYWQGLLALIGARVFGDLLLYPALGAGIAVGTAYTAAAVAALMVAPYITPVAIAGLLSVSGLTYLAYKKTKKIGERWVYWGIYHLLSAEEADPLMREQIRARAWIGPPLGDTGRSWSLMAAAGGARAPWSWTWWIPIAGPIYKANDRATMIKKRLRENAQQVLQDPVVDLPAADLATDILTGTEGWAGALGQALLIGGAASAILGGAAAGLQYQNNQDLGTYAKIAGISGFIGVGLAGAGLVAITVKKAANGLIPIVVPMSYPKPEALEAAAKSTNNGKITPESPPR